MLNRDIIQLPSNNTVPFGETKPFMSPELADMIESSPNQGKFFFLNITGRKGKFTPGSRARRGTT